jgi:hypothetical protein
MRLAVACHSNRVLQREASEAALHHPRKTPKRASLAYYTGTSDVRGQGCGIHGAGHGQGQGDTGNHSMLPVRLSQGLAASPGQFIERRGHGTATGIAH